MYSTPIDVLLRKWQAFYLLYLAISCCCVSSWNYIQTKLDIFLTGKSCRGNPYSSNKYTPSVLFCLSRFSSKNELAADKYSKMEVVYIKKERELVLREGETTKRAEKEKKKERERGGLERT
jgi:hypothetical protein